MGCQKYFSRLTAAGILFRAVLIFSAIWLGAGPALAEVPSLAIFHTNDVHGYALEAQDDSGRLTTIGYARAQAYVEAFPAENKLLLDAGDVLHGRPFATARRGEFAARVLDLMKYDALAVGNHDFNYGLARLMELRDRYALNFIAANVIEKEDGMPLLPPYIIKDFGDFKVGVFGLSTPATALKTSPANVESVTFGAPEEILALSREITRKLREEEGVDLVIALTHLGTDTRDEPSANLVAQKTPGLDLVIDGHSHSEVAGLKEGDALIVSTGAHFHNLGQVLVRRTPEGRMVLAPKLLPAAEFESVTPDPEVTALTERLESELDQEMRRVVGHTPITLNGERREVRRGGTNLGRVLCAAVKKATGADVAITNGGNIRGSIPAGDISQGQLLAVLPYENIVVTVELTGAELLEALNIGLGQPGEGGFPQFYGMEVTAQELKEYGPDGAVTWRNRAETVTVGGRPLDLRATYLVAINDFMQEGGDGYAVLKKPSVREHGLLVEILTDYLAEVSPETLEWIDQDDVFTIIVEEKAPDAA